MSTTQVETRISGYRGIRSFYSLGWDNERGQLLAVLIGPGNSVTAFDVRTGQQVGVYTSGSDSVPVSYELSPDNSRIVVFSTGDNSVMTIWNRDIGEHTQITPGIELSSYGHRMAISPDNRYLALSTYGQLWVWDLQAPTDSPTFVYDDAALNTPIFLDNMTVTASYNRTLQINVVTGERTILPQQQSPEPSAAIAGQTGWSVNSKVWNRYSSPDCDGIYPEYAAETRSLVINDTASGDTIRVIEENLNGIDFIRTSPDCRYLVAEVEIVSNADVPYDDASLDDRYTDRLSEILVVWDAQTGARLQEFPNNYRRESYSWLVWSPSGERAFVRTTAGHFVWDASSNQTVLLTYANRGQTSYQGIFTYPSVYWDYQRGQVIVSGWTGAYAFDMRTGAERYFFTAHEANRFGYGGCYISCGFSVSADNTTLFVEDSSAVGVWNLDTLESNHVDIRLKTGYLRDRIAISPDGRYLVIARAMIRVWDLYNLPENLEERDPVFNYDGPWARVRSVRFVDNITIETTSSEGVQRWNVETGELVE